MKTSLGAIVKYMPPGLEECRDGKFTTSANSGRCSRHGGVSMPGSMKASRSSSREAKFRRDAAAAPKVIIIPDRSAPASATSASLPPSMKPARVPYEGRCRFRNKVCRELDEQYEMLRKQAYDEGLVDDRLAPGASPHSREQHIGKLLKDINTVILSITKKEDAGSIKYIQEKLRALTMRMNILRSEKLAAQQKLEQPAQAVAATGVELIPIQAINIRRDWFQNRATPYSERSVENIVQAVQAGNFRWSQLDPVTLWVGPDGKLYMLSGHSRLEAFDRLCRSGAVVDGRSFCDIPAKIEANINLEQARRLALESNTLSTKETELERAEYYRAMRSQGKDADRDARRLEGDNWSTIIALSYLNPSGKTYTALRALEKGDATSKGNMRTIGRWIGNARAKYAILTNFHEDELYNWLVDNLGYGTRAGQVSNEREFNTRLASIINRRSTFGHLEDSLNIAANVTLSPVEAQYNQQVAEAAELIKVLQKQLDEKIREYRSRNATESQILELTAPLSAQLTRARIDYQSLMQKKGDITQYAKQEVNLFANLSGPRSRRKHMTA